MTPLDLHWAKKANACKALSSIFDEVVLVVSAIEDVTQPSRETQKIKESSVKHQTPMKSVKSSKSNKTSH